MTLSTDAAPSAAEQPAIAQPIPPAAPFTLDALRLVVVAGLWGVVAAFALIWRGLGLNVAVLSLLGVLALITMAMLERVRPAWRSAWLIAPLLFFGLAVAWRANPLIQLANVGAALGLALLLARVFTRPELFTQGVSGYLVLVLSGFLDGGLLQPGETLVAATRQSRTPGRSAWLWAIARGLLLAAPIVLVLTALLTLADLAFSQSVRDVLRALGLDDLGLVTARAVFAAVAAWAALGLLTLALRRRAAAPTAPRARTWSLLGFTEAAVVLGSVNALFLAFGVFQARYLFGGEANITAAGFTYADYARRGFGELVLVALIVLALGLALQRVTVRSGRPAALGFKALTVLLILQTGVLLASAFTRMRLYEEAYGFSQLRVLTQIFMIWLAVVLAAYGATVILDRPHLIALGGLVAAMGFVVTLDVFNLDGFIAHGNITRDLVQAVEITEYEDRSGRGREFDFVYVLSLSDDAVPELLALRSHPDPAVRAAAEESLSARYQALSAAQASDGWWSWTLGRHVALNDLTRLGYGLSAQE